MYCVFYLLQEKNKVLMVEGMIFVEVKWQAVEEYVIECVLFKVFGLEVFDYVVDEIVQVYGGMGYFEEGIVVCVYCDVCINCIYEGINEINCMFFIDMLFCCVLKGNFDIVGLVWEVQKELAFMFVFD